MQFEDAEESNDQAGITDVPLIPLPLDPGYKYNELIPFYAVNITNYSIRDNEIVFKNLRAMNKCVILNFVTSHVILNSRRVIIFD